MYGPYEWVRRTLTILLAGSLGVPIAVLAGVIGIGVPLAALLWAGYTSKVLFAFLLPVVMGGMLFGFCFAVRRSGKWTVRAETARWLAERQTGVGFHERRWRNRGIRVASGIPLTVVLVVFLFLPESWGVVSWLTRPRLHSLSGYQVSLPASWIILNYGNQPENGWSSITGLAGGGIGRGVAPYLRWAPPFSSWDIETDSAPSKGSFARWRMPSDDEVTGRRSFMIGADSITCLDYWPSYLSTGPYQRTQQFDDLSVAYIQCSDGRRFHAGFFGIRGQVAEFHDMLAGTAPTK